MRKARSMCSGPSTLMSVRRALFVALGPLFLARPALRPERTWCARVVQLSSPWRRRQRSSILLMNASLPEPPPCPTRDREGAIGCSDSDTGW